MPNHASVMVHVNKDLCKMEVGALKGELGRLPGVQEVSLGTGSTSHHLILVQYDSGAIESHAILEFLQQKGIEAQLVGM